ncbi:hypothetical protein [Streptomyces lydicus]|uniref:hypothetical protein n=1 Tax=Streptomyces lydicus TaxID=47763 RepID=UPI0036F144B2
MGGYKRYGYDVRVHLKPNPGDIRFPEITNTPFGNLVDGSSHCFAASAPSLAAALPWDVSAGPRDLHWVPNEDQPALAPSTR